MDGVEGLDLGGWLGEDGFDGGLGRFIFWFWFRFVFGELIKILLVLPKSFTVYFQTLLDHLLANLLLGDNIPIILQNLQSKLPLHPNLLLTNPQKLPLHLIKIPNGTRINILTTLRKNSLQFHQLLAQSGIHFL